MYGQNEKRFTIQMYTLIVVSFYRLVKLFEVMGMANFNKNLFVGVGGVEAINLSHFIGAITHSV